MVTIYEAFISWSLLDVLNLVTFCASVSWAQRISVGLLNKRLKTYHQKLWGAEVGVGGENREGVIDYFETWYSQTFNCKHSANPFQHTCGHACMHRKAQMFVCRSSFWSFLICSYWTPIPVSACSFKVATDVCCVCNLSPVYMWAAKICKATEY